MEKIKNKVRSVTRATGLLKAFSKPPHEWGITELGEHMQLSKGTVHLLVKTLEDEGFLEQVEETRKYRLGSIIYELAMQHTMGNIDLRSVARRYLSRMGNELSLPAYLATRIGEKVVLIDKVEPMLPFMVVLQIGAVLPYHSSALGKVILAYADDQKQEKIMGSLNLLATTSNTIKRIEELKTELKRVPQQGYALDREETLHGVYCMAVPIWEQGGSVVAALSVAAPTNKISDNNYNDFLPIMKKYSAYISRRLGYLGINKSGG